MPPRKSPDEICPDCGGPRSVYKPGHTYCPKCKKDAYDPAAQRVRSLRILYGITEEQYQELYEKQEGQCAICGQWQEVLAVDHEHGEKGIEAVRGLLCRKCNRAVGALGDTVEGLEKALNYLKAHEALLWGINTKGV